MSAPTAPAPTSRRAVAPGTTMYAVRSWDGDGEDITLYRTYRSAHWGAAHTAIDIAEQNDPEMHRELDSISDPNEIIALFNEAAALEGNWFGVSVSTVLIPD